MQPTPNSPQILFDRRQRTPSPSCHFNQWNTFIVPPPNQFSFRLPEPVEAMLQILEAIIHNQKGRLPLTINLSVKQFCSKPISVARLSTKSRKFGHQLKTGNGKDPSPKIRAWFIFVKFRISGQKRRLQYVVDIDKRTGM